MCKYEWERGNDASALSYLDLSVSSVFEESLGGEKMQFRGMKKWIRLLNKHLVCVGVKTVADLVKGFKIPLLVCDGLKDNQSSVDRH